MKMPIAKVLPVAVAVVALSGCEGGAYLLPNDANTAEISAPMPQTTVREVTLPASDAALAYLMSYPMPGVDGATRTESALVLVPQGNAPAQGWPLLAWAHPTVGVADVCAPTATVDLAGADIYLNGWLAAGYAIVAPDYEGLGSDGGHPYLNLASGGRSINYAVEAAAQEFETFSNRYAVVGHSQGGHAALGAAELAAENPQISLAAVVAAAPVSQIAAQDQALQAVVADDGAALADRVAAAVQRLTFGSLILHGVASVDDEFDLASAFGSSGGPLLEALETSCLADIGAALANSVPGALLLGGSTDTLLDPDIAQVPAVAAYLANNEPGRSAVAAPVLLQQGLADSTVFPSSTDALVDAMTQTNGQPPSLQSYADATHGSIVADGFSDALNFVNGAFAGE